MYFPQRTRNPLFLAGMVSKRFGQVEEFGDGAEVY